MGFYQDASLFSDKCSELTAARLYKIMVTTYPRGVCQHALLPREISVRRVELLPHSESWRSLASGLRVTLDVMV